jgi:membrane protein DedA with SNARE-associated domain
VAGAAGMTYPRFIGYNAVAATTWSATIVSIGYFLGGSWKMIQTWMGQSVLLVIGAFAIAAGILWLRRKMLRRRALPPA